MSQDGTFRTNKGLLAHWFKDVTMWESHRCHPWKPEMHRYLWYKPRRPSPQPPDSPADRWSIDAHQQKRGHLAVCRKIGFLAQVFSLRKWFLGANVGISATSHRISLLATELHHLFRPHHFCSDIDRRQRIWPSNTLQSIELVCTALVGRIVVPSRREVFSFIELGCLAPGSNLEQSGFRDLFTYYLLRFQNSLTLVSKDAERCINAHQHVGYYEVQRSLVLRVRLIHTDAIWYESQCFSQPV